MHLEPRIETLPEKHFVGHRVSMSLADNKTGALWRGFMPQRSQIQNSIGIELYSIDVYPPHYFANFNASAEFEKWAAVEVPDLTVIPAGMAGITTPEGLYAVFLYQGAASEGVKTYQYIYGTWIPASQYTLDDRPHFAVMGDKYKNDDPDSEEEFWIPVKV